MLARFALLVLLALPAQAQEMVIAPQFEAAGTFHRGAAPVQQRGVWGLMDRSGRFVAAPQYQRIQPGRDGYFAAQIDNSRFPWVHIDATGARITEYRTYAGVRNFREGWTAVTEGNGKWRLFDTQGDLVSSTEFDEIADWDPPFALVRRDGQWQVVHIGEFGFVNVVEAPFRNPLENATALRGLSERYFTADLPEGQRLLHIASNGWRPEPSIFNVIYQGYSDDVHFKRIGAASEGMIVLQDLQGQWGYYHIATSQQVWMGRFEQVRRFSDGYAAVKQNGKWGYIDRRGLFALTPRYDRAYDMHEGFATVRLGDKRGFVVKDPDQGLREFIAPQFEDVFRFQEGLAPVKLNGKWGYISNGQTPGPTLRQSAVETLVPD